ncbi:MAG TPA: coenzyme F420 hydrogenase [Pelotomaculum sp.]|nr:coenzyme F420 hydrogenase [Pelotomaculum sp.]
MAQVDYQELKKGGFMKQVQKSRFSLRLRIVGGQIQADQLQKVSEIAQKYGHGYIHMTSRQGIEIPFIKLEDINAVKEELSKVGLQPGACGPRVRTVTACQGEAICPSGLIDTTAFARELDSKYFALDLPHKFKFGITGCLNNCLKAEENDLGIKGGMKPVWQEEQCSFCGLCAAVCPTKAVAVKKNEKILRFHEKDCIYCGKCVKSCPAEAWQGQSGFLVYFGGMFGNRIATGQQLIPIIFPKDNLLKVIDTTLEFFKKHGNQGERFRNTLDRVGWELLQKELEVI